MKKKLLFFLVTFLSIISLIQLSAQEQEPIRIIYRSSDKIKNAAEEYNPIVEEIIKKAAITTGKYKVILQQEQTEPEYRTLETMQENKQYGYYNTKDKESGIKDFKLSFTAPKSHIAYTFYYDYDSENNKLYYLSLSKIDVLTNKEVIKRTYSIDSAQMSNFSTSVWQNCLDFFGLPSNLPTFKYTDPGLVLEYNNPNNCLLCFLVSLVSL